MFLKGHIISTKKITKTLHKVSIPVDIAMINIFKTKIYPQQDVPLGLGND